MSVQQDRAGPEAQAHLVIREALEVPAARVVHSDR